MFTNATRPGPALLSPVILGILALLPALARADVPTDREQRLRVTSQGIPDPPLQDAEWKPPTSKVPHDFVYAVRLVFDQGLADPRGCDYRDVEVVTGSSRFNNDGITPTRGWVLPPTDGDGRRFVVCWNGMVYPMLSCGKRADLDSDVKAVVARLLKPDEPTVDAWRPRTSAEGTVWHGTLGNDGDLATALLLRLGKGDLASALWAANHPAEEPVGRGVREKNHPYLSLVSLVARTRFNQALGGHRRGDDAVALDGFRRLKAFATAAEATAKLLNNGADKDWPASLGCLAQVPTLLADQERRAKEPSRAAVVCMGPGRHPNASVRIAALVARLDEVCDGTQLWGGNDLSDPVVRALIREGEPALEPLLKCFENDKRLTRGGYIPNDRFGGHAAMRCQDVHKAAESAIDGILSRAYIELSPEEDLILRREATTTGREVARYRELTRYARWLSPAERWYTILAEDRATPAEWTFAATALADRGTDPVGPETTVWTRRLASKSRGTDDGTALGEPLRGKKHPSVTDLMLLRLEQCKETEVAADLAEALARWEPKAALLEPLVRRSNQLRAEPKSGHQFAWLVQKRCELGDRTALDDYVAWVGLATPKILDGIGRYSQHFDPMGRYPTHPGMAAAAEHLFGDEKSPWLPLFQHGERGSSCEQIPELIATNLLRQPVFRKAVLKELDNRVGEGTVQVRPDGRVEIRRRNSTEARGGGSVRELDVPEGGVNQTFRVCDFVAWQICEKFDAAPRCELYWPEERRDKAVAACGAFLRHYGDHLFQDASALKRDKPATPEQVKKGTAVFSLAGEGAARLVGGLTLPCDARWVTLKHRPYLTEDTDRPTGKITRRTAYRQDGKVVQAEEVFKDGKWRRYYGFAGANQIARVPAEEIEFPPTQPWRRWDEPREGAWVHVGTGLHARLDVPPLTVEAFDDFPPRLPSDAVLTFGLVVRNAGGLDQPCPAPEQVARLRLLYSPAVISRQGALVPQAARAAEWLALPSKPGATFKAEKGKTLAVMEETKAATFDLRAWFDMGKPGFYRVQLLPDVQTADVPSGPVGEVRFALAPSGRGPGRDK